MLAVVIVSVLAAGTALVAGAALAGPVDPRPGAVAAPTSPSRPQPAKPPAVQPVSLFDPLALSLDDPASLWVVVNKDRPLEPETFEPADLVVAPVEHMWRARLRAPAAEALTIMFAAFTTDSGLSMQAQSSYRSFHSQTDTYQASIQLRGQAATDQIIAHPGSSEHQTGLAVDISALPADCTLEACFAATPQGVWLAKNAWKYGFVLRYPPSKVATTGYESEPWHYRFVGLALAAQLQATKTLTLEEFFSLNP